MSDSTAIILQGDPTVAGFQAPYNTLGYSFTTGLMYIKTGSAPTGWTALASNAAATPSSNGLMTAAQATQLAAINSSLNGGSLLSVYSTPLLDLTQTQDNIAMGFPIDSAHIFISRLVTVVLHDGAGVATGNLVYSIGNDTGHENVVGPDTLASGSINPLVAILPQAAFANGGGTGAIPNAGTQIVGKIGTGVTGITSLHGYIVVLGFWIPA